MKSKHLLMLLLFVLFAPCMAHAQTVTIGDPNTTQIFAGPIANNFNYSFAEMLYTASEFGSHSSNVILSVGFQSTSSTDLDVDYGITIYMKNVDATSFTSTTAVVFNESEHVYTGTASPKKGWTTIELDHPFTYDPQKSLLIAVNKTSGGVYGSSVNWVATYDATNYQYKTLYKQRDNSPFVPTQLPQLDLSYYRPNIQITFGQPSQYPKPSDLVVTEVTSNSARLSWTANGNNATGYVVQYGTDPTFANGTYTEQTVNTTTTAFTGLTLLTNYYTRVQARYGNNASAWSNPVSFRTANVSVTIGDDFADDFEGSLGWDLVNGTIHNAWAWGTAANNGGAHGLYVSNDNGGTNAYSNQSAMVYATKLFHFTADKYTFAFDWKANGESWDYLRVALVPASVQLEASQATPSGFSGSSLPNGWIALDGGSQLYGHTSWQRSEVPVNVPEGNWFVVFAWRNDATGDHQPPAAVDNFSITRMTCPYDAENLAATVTPNSATLTWTGGASNWQVAWSASSNFPESGTTYQDNVTSPLTLSGLQPNTSYYVKVRAHCEGSDYGTWSPIFSFITDCNPDVIPYTYDFENAAAWNCWTPYNQTATRAAGNNHTANGNYALRFSGSTSNMVALPQFTTATSLLQVQFWTRPGAYNNSNCGTFEVGYLTNINNTSTFVPVSAYSVGEWSANTYELKTVYLSLSSAPANAIIAFRHNANAANAYWFVDDVTISLAPSCYPVGELSLSDLTYSSVKLSWTLNDATQTAWQVQYATDAEFTQGVQTLDVNSHENVMLSGLTPEIVYYVRVRAHCGGSDYSEWSNVASFIPPCPVPTNVTADNITTNSAKLSWDGSPNVSYTIQYRTAATMDEHFSEGFENATEYATWNAFGVVNTNTGSYFGRRTVAKRTGNYGFSFSSRNSATNYNQYLVSPELTSLGSNEVLEFYYRAYASTASETFRVGYSTLANGNVQSSDFTWSAPITTNSEEWLKYELSLPDGVKRIAFNYCSVGHYELYIDDIVIGNASPAGQWTTATANTNRATLSSLIQNTMYEVQVKSDCSDPEEWSAPAFFSTLESCPMPTNVTVSEITPTTASVSWTSPLTEFDVRYRKAETTGGITFAEDFEDANEYESWHAFGIESDNTGPNYFGRRPNAKRTGEYGFCFSSSRPSENYDQYLVSPVLTSVNGGILEFYYRAASAYYIETFKVGYSTMENADVQTEGDFTWSDQIATNSVEWLKYEFQIPAGVDVKHIAFYYYSTGRRYYLYIDDIAIGTHTSYPWSEVIPVTGTTSYTLRNLEENTTYEVQVKSGCSESEDDWSTSTYFTTPEPCDAPTNLTVEAVTATSATLSWTGMQDDYNVQYRVAASVDFFEDFNNGIPLNWTRRDADGDGNNWMTGVVGGIDDTYCATSASYNSATETELYPDNWLITPQLTLGGTMKVWLRGQDPNWPDEHFAIYLSLTGTSVGDFTTVLVAESAATGEYVEYTADLSSYEGQSGYIAIRHFNCSDLFRLNVDNFGIYGATAPAGVWQSASISGNQTTTITGLNPETNYEFQVQGNCGGGQSESEWVMANFTTLESCSTPGNLTASDVTTGSAVLSWTGDNETYDLHYRAYTAGFFEDFEAANALDGWMLVDADGDGHNWTLGQPPHSSHSGTGCVYSASYDNTAGAALTPDNWLISPLLELGDMVSFWAVGQDEDWPAEHFAIYVSMGGTDPDDFVQISPEYIATGVYTEYSADLTGYAGTGRIAIRHFNVTDMFQLNIDDFGVYSVQNPAGGWDFSSSTTVTTITVEELRPGTHYGWQVQGKCVNGDSHWSDMAYFSTAEICPAPTSLTVSNLTPTSADLSWEGDSDSYTVRYRKSATYVLNSGYFQDFDGVNPLEDWKLVDADGDNHNWELTTEMKSHSGFVCVTSASYDNDAGPLSPDNWLISPVVELRDAVKFWAVGQDENWPAEHFAIYVSTSGGTELSDFVQISPEYIATDTYTEYIADLTGYSGTGRIAIRHFNVTDMFHLNIDDFGIYDLVSPAQPWVEINTNENTLTLSNLEVLTGYDWQVESECGTWSQMTHFTTPNFVNVFETPGNWNVASNWSLNALPQIEDDVVIAAAAVIPSDYTAQVNAITITTGSLTIEDGGQLRHTNEGVIATMKKEITGYTGFDDHYYLIATPMVDGNNPANVTNMLSNTYDLYRYDGSAEAEWKNYRIEPFNLVNGKGYLYANSETVTLSFTGELHPFESDIANGMYALDYSNSSSEDIRGFNLVGNMFATEGYMVVVVADGEYYDLASDVYFYRMGETELIASEGAVAPLEGVFVQASDDDQVALCYTRPIRNDRGALNVCVSQNGQLIDAAYLRFDDGHTLKKFQLNEGKTKLYIPQEGLDYAVVNAQPAGEMPISFKAEKNGTYTLNFTNEEVSFNHLHLIDNLTGADIDLLVTPSYTFTARTTDYASRFRLIFATGTSSDEGFAFYSNGNWIISNEGKATLQVIDVMGRILSSETFSGSCSTAINANPGVYVLRLITGDQVKVQKIIVR